MKTALLVLLFSFPVFAADPAESDTVGTNITIDFDGIPYASVGDKYSVSTPQDTLTQRTNGIALRGKTTFSKDFNGYKSEKYICLKSKIYNEIQLSHTAFFENQATATVMDPLKHHMAFQHLKNCKTNALLVLSNPKKYLLRLRIWEQNNADWILGFCENDQVVITNLVRVNECQVVRKP